jgi:hypothetical protein
MVANGKKYGILLMSRCQHCKKLTHSEDVNVYYDVINQEAINELAQMEHWTPKFLYAQDDFRSNAPQEFGKLRVGDIVLHFIASK